MNQNSEDMLLHRIAQAAADLTPEQPDRLWEEPVEPAKETDWFLDGTDAFRRRRKKRLQLVRAAAACLVLCFLSAAVLPFLTCASVYLDVNPSLELDVNYRGRVTRVTPCNEDGVRILGSLDLRGADLDVALYALLGSMVHTGYLTEETDTILVSVECGSSRRAAALETRVTGTISTSLDQMIQAGQVLSQQVEPEQEEDDDDQGFTPGKAAFIEDLLERYPQLKREDLEAMTMDQIVELLDKEDLDYSDYLDDEDDDADDTDYDDADEEDDDSDDDDDEDDDDDRSCRPGPKEDREDSGHDRSSDDHDDDDDD